MKRVLAAAMAGLLLIACGGQAGARPNLSPSSGGRSPSPTSGPTRSATSLPTPPPTSIPAIQAGTEAYVAVSVATGWRNPSVVRPIDIPALANPVSLREWIATMNWTLKADLIDRADTQLLLGDRVVVVSLSGEWAQVVIPNQPTPKDARGYPAWIPVGQLSSIAPPATPTAALVVTPTAEFSALDGTATTELSFGTRLPVIAALGSSLQVGLPGGRRAMIPLKYVASSAAGTLPPTAASVVASARQFLGLSYLWAGTSGFGFDCSGLVYLVYRAHGVLLPRDADAQARAGSWVPRASLQPGDLVFFGGDASTIHHVAVYIGDGDIIESPQTGSPVRVIPLSTYSDYFTARHVLP